MILMPNSKLITCAEFQLFLDENPDFAPDHWQEPRFPKGEGKKPLLGLTSSAAQAFCNWLTQRESDTGWFYRLPEIGELSEGECYWTTKERDYELSYPRVTEMNLEDWLIDPQISLTPYLSGLNVKLSGYYIIYIAKVGAYISTIVHIRALALEDARNRASALAYSLENTFSSVTAFISTLAFAYNREPAFALARTLSNALASANALATDRILAGINALVTDRTLASANALATANGLVNNLSNIVTSDSQLDKLLELFIQVAKLIKGNIEMSIINDPDFKNRSPVRLLHDWGELETCRRSMLERADEHYLRRPSKINSPEWETWKRELDELLQAYATLVMYEKRRTGEWQPFEGLRIVKARRKD